MDNGLVLTVQLMVNLKVTVLILVVVDNGLVLRSSISVFVQIDFVLILVVVDNGLVHSGKLDARHCQKLVLILVVVDNGLVLDLKNVLMEVLWLS